jgi:protein-S-isoprenylcysteine O-methyltransferase Ste14
MDKFFDSFQITALIFFLLVFVSRTLYLRFSKGVRPITLGIGKQGIQRIVEISFLVGLIIWITEVVLHARHAKSRIFPSPLYVQLIDSIPAKLIGVALIVVGFIIFVWALSSFGDSWRIGIDRKTPGELVTTGIFAVSRNPIFVFVNLYFVGTFLVTGTLIFLIFALLIVPALHYQIIQEEKFLVKAYGEVYQDYCARTERYFMGF